MAKIEESIEVNVPVATAYNQWTQFEYYPHFMENVEQVEQVTDDRLKWVAKVGGERKEWFARIVRQVPDEIISWESEGGSENSGTVRFSTAESGGTKVDLEINIEPEGLKESLGSAVGVPGSAVKGDLKRFKEFIEERASETGAWRGTIPPTTEIR